MISDRYISLTRRVVTLTPGTDGGTTESTSDSTFYGYIADISGYERRTNNQVSVSADAILMTDATLDETDRVVDGSIVFEITYKYLSGNRYDLKRLK